MHIKTGSPRATPDLAGRHERVEGVHVLRLAGDDYAMGYQHGALLRDAIARGPLPYFASYVERFFARSLGVGALGGPLTRAMGTVVGRSIARNFPPHVLDGLEGLADGSGLSRDALLRAVTMPETYLWVLTQYQRARGYPTAPRLGVPLYGCSSVAAWGKNTPDGALLHGRNFDYQGVGAWDEEPVVAFHRPTDGQRYVSVSAAGVLYGGVTAMNEAGLSLAVHQHVAATRTALGGLPIGVQGDRVMRHARTLDEARKVLDDHVPNGCWTYVITSAHEGAALCYEVTPTQRAHRVFREGAFHYTNVFLDREIGRTEVHSYPSYWRWNTGRYHRLAALIEAHRGRIDPDRVAAFLADTGDAVEGGCRLRNAPCCLTTVASVVFRPADGVVWVATGRAPVASRRFIAFKLDTERHDATVPALTGGEKVDPEGAAAFDAFRAAYEADFNREDLREARTHMDAARRLAPSQPLYHFMAGLLALNARDWRSAELAFDRALELGHKDEERVAAFELWRGRASDAQGRRDEALTRYRRALALRADPGVVRAALRGQASAWKPREVGIEWNMADVPAP